MSLDMPTESFSYTYEFIQILDIEHGNETQLHSI